MQLARGPALFIEQEVIQHQEIPRIAHHLERGRVDVGLGCALAEEIGRSLVGKELQARRFHGHGRAPHVYAGGQRLVRMPDSQ